MLVHTAEEQVLGATIRPRGAAGGAGAHVANLKAGTRRSPRPAFLDAQEAGWRIRLSVARGCLSICTISEMGVTSTRAGLAWWGGNLPGRRAKGPAVGAGCGLVLNQA